MVSGDAYAVADEEGEEEGEMGGGFDRENSIDNAGGGGGGLPNAYNFMRLRRRRMAKTSAGTFINSLRLGGSVSTESERSVGPLLSSLPLRQDVVY